MGPFDVSFQGGGGLPLEGDGGASRFLKEEKELSPCSVSPISLMIIELVSRILVCHFPVGSLISISEPPAAEVDSSKSFH